MTLAGIVRIYDEIAGIIHLEVFPDSARSEILNILHKFLLELSLYLSPRKYRHDPTKIWDNTSPFHWIDRAIKSERTQEIPCAITAMLLRARGMMLRHSRSIK